MVYYRDCLHTMVIETNPVRSRRPDHVPHSKHKGDASDFLAAAIVVFVCYTLYAVLQEYILKQIAGYNYGAFMTLIQFGISATLMSAWWRWSRATRKAPIRSYGLLSLLSTATVGLSNVSCTYLNYPTQVLCKNGKLIPVMLVGRFWLKKQFSVEHQAAVGLLTTGLVIFSLGASITETQFNAIGFVLISLAVTADAFMGNVQELLMRSHSCTTMELIFFTKLLGTGIAFIACVVIGELMPALRFCLETPSVLLYLLAYSVFGFVGELSVLTLVQKFGAIEAVTVTSLRKMITIVLSFVIFPKPATASHYVGGLIVFVGIVLNVYAKNKRDLDPILQRILSRFHPYRHKRSYSPLAQSAMV